MNTNTDTTIKYDDHSDLCFHCQRVEFRKTRGYWPTNNWLFPCDCDHELERQGW